MYATEASSHLPSHHLFCDIRLHHHRLRHSVGLHEALPEEDVTARLQMTCLVRRSTNRRSAWTSQCFWLLPLSLHEKHHIQAHRLKVESFASSSGVRKLQDLDSTVLCRFHEVAHRFCRTWGAVPDEWIRARSRTRRCACSLSVAASRGIHPSCRHSERQATQHDRIAASSVPAPIRSERRLPTLDVINSCNIPTVRYVPKHARAKWAAVLAHCLAFAVHTNSMSAWTE